LAKNNHEKKHLIRQTSTIFQWGPPKGGADAHGIDLDALAAEQLPMGEGKEGAP